MVGLLGLGSLVVLAPAAQAHAVLVSSTPAAGARLGATPAMVTLVFDEPLAPTLSRAAVAGPGGTRFAAAVKGATMRARLTGNVPGIYRVEWKTVSEIDGHTITGSFQFGVAVSVSGAVSTPAPRIGDYGISALRAVEYALLLLLIGMAVLERLRPALRQPVVLVALALLLSGVLVVGAEAVDASSGISGPGAVDYMTNGLTGWARGARVLLEAGLLLVAVLRRRASAILLVATCGAVAVAGHGANVEPAWQGMAVNAAHLISAGVWAGGIMALGLLRWRGRWAAEGRLVLPRFSRVAPWAFAISVWFGAVQAFQLLGGPGALLGTDYGLTLVAKSVAIAAMVPLSLLAWRRARVHVRAEAGIALLVVALAAALAAFPVVPKEAREAAEAAGGATPAATSSSASPQPRRLSAFPGAGDFTMGARAGNVMVGLSLDPGRPGPNVARVYVADPARTTATARVSTGHGWTRLSKCGDRCRTAKVSLHVRDRVLVEVSGPQGGTATFQLPRLPAREGSVLMARATKRMDALTSYRVYENLSGIRSTYAYARPHQMFVRTWFGDGAVDTLWLGRTVYRRDAPGKPWRLQANTVLAPVPYFVWKPFKPLANLHVLGEATVSGVHTQVLSMFGGHGRDPEPVWFTVYVDPATRLVLRSRMWAPNHFMDDRYFAVNRPVTMPTPGEG